MSAARCGTLVALVLFTGACASTIGPTKWLPTPTEMGQSPYGGWIEAKTGPSDSIGGELVAAGRDSLWILTASRPRVLATKNVVWGRLIAWNSETGKAAAWQSAGLISTLSNGYFLILTAPMWLIGGTIAAAHQAQSPVMKLPPSDWTSLRIYARFPQGLPSGVRLETLRIKP